MEPRETDLFSVTDPAVFSILGYFCKDVSKTSGARLVALKRTDVQFWTTNF